MSNKYKILNSNVSANTHEFLVDEIADIGFLPTESGSTAIVAENSDVYICNNTKQWIKFDSINGEETAFPSGKIIITENGTDIDIAQYATADVNVASSSGASFGEVQNAVYVESSKPTVGSAWSVTSLDISHLNSDAQTEIVVLPTPAPVNVASGVYVKTKQYNNVDAADGYVCEYSFAGGAPKFSSVTSWDGQVDDLGLGAFGFVMPDIKQVSNSTILVLHIYKK